MTDQVGPSGRRGHRDTGTQGHRDTGTHTHTSIHDVLCVIIRGIDLGLLPARRHCGTVEAIWGWVVRCRWFVVLKPCHEQTNELKTYDAVAWDRNAVGTIKTRMLGSAGSFAAQWCLRYIFRFFHSQAANFGSLVNHLKLQCWSIATDWLLLQSALAHTQILSQ